MSRVLVTGADGFIGSHLCEQLVHEGYMVRALCMYNFSGSWGWLDTLSPGILKNIDVHLSDIRDPFAVKKLALGVDTIYHLAALIGIPYSYLAPQSYIETNISGTLNILEAAKESTVSRVVITSTSETYGSAQYVPIDERHPLNAQSPYAATKIAADQLSLSYYRSFGLPVSILRPFNTYGPRQSTRAIIPSIIIQLLKNPSEIKLGSLEPTRDFNYVSDICSAFIKVANSAKCLGKVVNACSSFEISIEDTLNIISELLNVDYNLITDDMRVRPALSEVNRLYGDNSLITQLADWSPGYSGIHGFKNGLANTINWFSETTNMQFYKKTGYGV